MFFLLLAPFIKSYLTQENYCHFLYIINSFIPIGHDKDPRQCDPEKLTEKLLENLFDYLMTNENTWEILDDTLYFIHLAQLKFKIAKNAYCKSLKKKGIDCDCVCLRKPGEMLFRRSCGDRICYPYCTGLKSNRNLSYLND